MLIRPFHIFQFIRFIFWMAVMVVTGGLFLAAVNSKHQDVVEDVRYSIIHLHDGNDLITLEEVRDIVFKTFNLDLKGVAVDNLDLEHIENVLMGAAFIVDADAFIDAQRVLHIEVTQRIPILRVIQLDGTSYYLDSEGIKIPLSENFTARVPVITGHMEPYSSGFLGNPESNLGAIFKTVQHIRQDPVLHAWLEEIHVDHQRELVLFGNVGNFSAIMGRGTDIEMKLANMKLFLHNGMESVGWNTPCSINLKYDAQVVVAKNSIMNSQINY